MMCYRHFLIDDKDKVTKKYHPIRFYVMNTDMPRNSDQPCSILLVRFGKGAM